MDNIRERVIGERINLERTCDRHKMTLEELAEKMSVTRQTVSKWEKGKATPTVQDLLKLCDIFECDYGYLVGDFDTRKHLSADIQNETGLSEKAIEVLQEINREFPDNLKILSNMIESLAFPDLLDSLRHYAMIGYAARTSIPKHVFDYIHEEQARAMALIEQQKDSISDIEIRFLALKSNLGLDDIAALYLNECRDNISYIAKEISQPEK